MIKDVQQYAETKNEREIYFAIDMCGGFIWRMNHDMAHGRIDDQHHAPIQKAIDLARADQLVLVKALTRFGVDTPLDANGRPTDQYWLWFRWWDGWKKGMSDDEWRECEAAMSREMTAEEETKHRPSGSWQA